VHLGNTKSSTKSLNRLVIIEPWNRAVDIYPSTVYASKIDHRGVPLSSSLTITGHPFGAQPLRLLPVRSSAPDLLIKTSCCALT
jgi:hypothetical protein